MLKEGGEKIKDYLKILFNKCLFEGQILQKWNKANTILICKKENRSKLANYRPISLLSQIYKTFTKVKSTS
ncbi:unnamed protein product [Diabrotica balteata]|uniref:Reverse transcriptase domain-containing protein n=1 Tax=Diabrotica balteata TaxID=107213 RepID=A0A9N9SY59_DIABA|nr:unnamed protein product [Diabrotica balteata]